ncbi:MAG: LEA type 2 family protein [Flammeovirgaceae bacterium]
MFLPNKNYFYACMKMLSVVLFLSLLVISCLPKEQVVFKTVRNIELTTADGKVLLKGDAVFYNPNKTQTKLKEIDVDVMVDGKKAASVDQQMSLDVKGKSDFTVPIEAQLQLGEINLLDAVVGFLGGKTYQVTFTGNLRVAVHGLTVKVPVKYNESVKLR